MSERSWGTVREDYSPDGNAWDYFPHDLARSKAYRWGEDGLAGICDRYQGVRERARPMPLASGQIIHLRLPADAFMVLA